MLYIMVFTGLRCGELCGLTMDDIDLEHRCIHVRKQLACINHTHVVLPTKTVNSQRCIPMSDGVYEAFKRVLENRYLKGDIEPVCYDERGNAYEGFVFLATRSRKTIVRGHVEEYLQNCLKRYNLAHPDSPMRKFEPHILRHTFATLIGQRMSVKTTQSILGHADSKTTLDIYTDARPTDEQVAEINKAVLDLAV